MLGPKLSIIQRGNMEWGNFEYGEYLKCEIFDIENLIFIIRNLLKPKSLKYLVHVLRHFSFQFLFVL